MPKEIKSREELFKLHDDLQARVNSFLERLKGEKESDLPPVQSGGRFGRVLQSLQESPQVQAQLLTKEIKNFETSIDEYNSSMRSRHDELKAELKSLNKVQIKLEPLKLILDEETSKKLLETKQAIDSTIKNINEINGQFINPKKVTIDGTKDIESIAKGRSEHSYKASSSTLKKDLRAIAKQTKREERRREPGDTLRLYSYKTGEAEMMRKRVAEDEKLHKPSSKAEKEELRGSESTSDEDDRTTRRP